METVIPFRLKWAGGKRWLAEQLFSGLPSKSFRMGLCEPFAGGAALTFASMPHGVHLSDLNPDLMATYIALRDAPDEVAAGLTGIQIDAKTFARIRASSPGDPIETAVRMIYLNRTAFGGLWRVNRSGRFNVPFGCKPETTLPDTASILATSQILTNARLEVGDFERVCRKTMAAMVYLDPPYTVTHNNNGFLRYNEKLFTWADQERLALTAQRLAAGGRDVIVSNAFHRDVIRLYSQIGFRIYAVSRNSNLSRKSSGRGKTLELLAVCPSLRFRRLPTSARLIRV